MHTTITILQRFGSVSSKETPIQGCRAVYCLWGCFHEGLQVYVTGMFISAGENEVCVKFSIQNHHDIECQGIYNGTHFYPLDSYFQAIQRYFLDVCMRNTKRSLSRKAVSLFREKNLLNQQQLSQHMWRCPTWPPPTHKKHNVGFGSSRLYS